MPMVVEESLLLKKIDTRLFIADKNKLWRPRAARGVFGGQVIGQALVAATHSVNTSSYSAHSLHCYFILPGDPKSDIIYYVEDLRDGKSFVTRSVEGRQNGRAIFKMLVQFHTFEEGSPYLNYSIPMPKVKYQPEELLPTESIAAYMAENDLRLSPWTREYFRQYSKDSIPVDRRPVSDFNRKLSGSSSSSFSSQEEERTHYMDMVSHPGTVNDNNKPKHEIARRQFWFKSRESVGNADAAHKSVLACMTDFELISTSLQPLGGIYCINLDKFTSLDHSLYFHQTNVRADDWMLFDMRCLIATHARALCVCHIFSRDGELICTAMQEGLVRLGNPPLRNDVFIQGSSLKKEEEEGKRQQQQQENKKNGVTNSKL